MAAERDWERRIGGRLKLRDLHILSKVVEWGSMVKAASHLGMSQPAVSEAIANLEAALRVRLLDRNARGIEPTIYAATLLKRERVVFDELQQGIKEIEFLLNPEAGEVRLGTSEILAAGLVPKVIDRLLRRYPKIFVRVSLVDTATVEFRELRDRNVELLLARVPESLVDDDINIEVFFDDPHFVAAGASNPWVKRRNVNLADLVNEAWVFPKGQVVRGIIADAFRADGLPMPNEHVTTDTVHIRNHLLATGRFLTIIAGSVLHYNARQWSLKALPIDLRAKPRPHAIVTLKNRTLNPVAELFVRELKAAANFSLSKCPAVPVAYRSDGAPTEFPP
jgi:DNA-binding transcriptional LysR family regulator